MAVNLRIMAVNFLTCRRRNSESILGRAMNMTVLRSSLLLLGLSLFIAVPCRIHAQSPDGNRAEIESLQKQVDALQTQVQELQGQLAKLKSSAPAAPDATSQ